MRSGHPPLLVVHGRAQRARELAAGVATVLRVGGRSVAGIADRDRLPAADDVDLVLVGEDADLVAVLPAVVGRRLGVVPVGRTAGLGGVWGLARAPDVAARAVLEGRPTAVPLARAGQLWMAFEAHLAPRAGVGPDPVTRVRRLLTSHVTDTTDRTVLFEVDGTRLEARGRPRVRIPGPRAAGLEVQHGRSAPTGGVGRVTLAAPGHDVVVDGRVAGPGPLTLTWTPGALEVWR